jgi:hypothetical protein
MAVKTALNQNELVLPPRMENFEQRWKQVELLLQERFGKLPDMEGILFLIGMNELGALPSRKFSKEQKQDLMHIAVCTLLSQKGYYKFAGRDEDGWPHYDHIKPVPAETMQAQEGLLKECVIEYFGC